MTEVGEVKGWLCHWIKVSLITCALTVTLDEKHRKEDNADHAVKHG